MRIQIDLSELHLSLPCINSVRPIGIREEKTWIKKMDSIILVNHRNCIFQNILCSIKYINIIAIWYNTIA